MKTEKHIDDINTTMETPVELATELATVDLFDDNDNDSHGIQITTHNSYHYLSEHVLSQFDSMLEDIKEITFRHICNIDKDKNLTFRACMERFDEVFTPFIKQHGVSDSLELDLSLFLSRFMYSYISTLEALISAQAELGNLIISFKDNHEFNTRIGTNLEGIWFMTHAKNFLDELEEDEE